MCLRLPVILWPRMGRFALAALLAAVYLAPPAAAQRIKTKRASPPRGDKVARTHSGDASELPQELHDLMKAAEPERSLSPDEQQAAELLQQHLGEEALPGDPASILRALLRSQRSASTVEKAKPPTKEAAVNDELRERLVTRDWEGIRKYLSQLPDKLAPHVFASLLELLASSGGYLWPDDVLQLAAVAPGDLSDRQLLALGQLLAQAVARIGKPRVMLSQLQRGTARLGGDDPAKRRAAARLLLYAGLVEEAGVYVPPLDEARRSKDVGLLNLVALYHENLGRKRSAAEILRQAWECTRAVLDDSTASDSQRIEALQRAARLLGRLPKESYTAWLRETLTRRGDLAGQFTTEVAQLGESTFRGLEAEPRLAALQVHQIVVRELVSLPGDRRRAERTAVELLAVHWLRDAIFTLERRAGFTFPDHLPALAAEDLLGAGPDEAWLAALSADLGRAVRRALAELAVRVVDRPRFLAVLPKIQEDDPALARKLASDFLGQWLGRFREEPRREVDDWHGLITSHRSRSERRGIPLIRARQVRLLDELVQLLGEIQAAQVTDVNPQAKVRAFEACHSPAEVYHEEDLRRVFGEPTRLPTAALVAVMINMRKKLAEQWRQPELQEQSGTQRTDPELVAEIVRGYGLAAGWLRDAAANRADPAEVQALLATVYFDQAEFLYGQQVDLATYTGLREQAFATYRAAAASYAAQLPRLPPERQTAEVYLQWFRSALGSSDLTYLTRQDKPERTQVEQIGAAMRSLGSSAAEAHLKLFGEATLASAGQAPPHLKPHYLREALQVLGAHPAGRPARELVQFYDELLKEVELQVSLDGSAEVGHDRRFGVHVMVRCSKALARESDGFAHLLASPSNGPSPHKQALEREIRDKLGKSFAIETIRFHDPTVTPSGFGRAGWQQMPLAYLVLRANDPSVDRLPPLQLDLEFADGEGEVLLPITSQVVLISAGGHAAPRPCRDIEVKQLLDDRRLHEGKLRLEITATGRGLLPDLSDLLDLDALMAGAAARAIQDHGLDVNSLETRGPAITAMCTRSWSLELEVGSQPRPTTFAFPEPKAASRIAYQRYSDADVETVGQVVNLNGPLLAGRRWLAWAAGALMLGAAAAATAFLGLRRRAGRRPTDAPAYRRPQELTPFSLLVLLNRMQSDARLRFSAAERRALSDTITELDRRYFAGVDGDGATQDLSTMLEPWLARANATLRDP
jgi:hypothetical protein